MNDRFRFRAFYKPHNKIYNVICLNSDKQKEIIIEYKGSTAIVEWKNCDILQCTGLKDKNGKLIFEGDIINDKSNHIRVVAWEQDGFKYPALKTSRYFHSPISNKLEERKVDLRAKLTFQDNVYKCDKKHFEVIGNIYENKGLLNENS